MMVPALGDASSPQQDATIPVTSGLPRAAVGQATAQPPPAPSFFRFCLCLLLCQIFN